MNFRFSEIKNFSPLEELAISILFSDKFYLRQNDDVRMSGKDPIEHFLRYGFAEKRNPSQLFSFSYLDQISAFGLDYVPSQLTEFGEVMSALQEWPSEAVFGPSSLVCPIWLSLQIGSNNYKSLKELLDHTLLEGSFSPHPGMRPLTVDEPVTIADLLHRLEPSDFADHSVVCLSDYCAQHVDLNGFRDNYEAAFTHLWTHGPFENRLKYMGNQRGRKSTPENQLASQIATAAKQRLLSVIAVSSEGERCLTNKNVTHLSADHSAYQLLSDLVKFHAPAKSSCDVIGMVSELGPFIWSDNALSIKDVSVGMVEVGASATAVHEIYDTDLLSGAKRVATKRVFYTVNIGSYDDIPSPPHLDDCSYFLITDATEVPRDTPWTIVRPTLKERDIKRLCLWYKTHPHRLFPDAMFSTWSDSNIIFEEGASAVIFSHEQLSELATFIHPDRDCIYDEAKEVLAKRLDDEETISRVVAELRQKDFPASGGLYETNVLFSRIGDRKVREFFDIWWRRISLGSRRDQMSFTVAADAADVSISPIFGKTSAKNCRYFSKSNHLSVRGRFV